MKNLLCKSALHFLHDTDNAKWVCHLPPDKFHDTEGMLRSLPDDLNGAYCTSWDHKPKPELFGWGTTAICALGDIFVARKGNNEYTYILTPRGWIEAEEYARGIEEAKRREAERIERRDAARKLAEERKKSEQMFLLGNVAHVKENGHGA